jgi:uncharacterized protein with PQ loop repeat
VVVFSPQIIENFRRSSADGLSLIFIIVWLLGDVFNILGAVLQGVLPTMTILAVYYTLADLVLLGQCFYYRGFTLSDAPTKKTAPRDEQPEDTEDTPLLDGDPDLPVHLTAAAADNIGHRKLSISSIREHLTAVDGTHLSPATPLLPPPRSTDPPAVRNLKPTSTFQTLLFNTTALFLVCAAGVFGWWLSTRSSHYPYDRPRRHEHRNQTFSLDSTTQDRNDLLLDPWGQIFGYLCTIFYLGSRIPQILLNHRRKSTEGVSMLFFLFACVGNLTYVMSILAFQPACAMEQDFAGDLGGSHRDGCEQGQWSTEYWQYMIVNLSWLIGSAGTLLLDLGIFAQFWIYRGRAAQSAIQGGEDE